MGAFLGMLGTAAVIIGVISLFRPIRKLGIQTRKTAAIVLAAGVVLMVIGGALTPETEEPAPAQQTASAPGPAAQLEPEPESEPEGPLEEQELTEDVVRQLAGLEDITNVRVIFGVDPNEKLIHIEYRLGSIRNEDHGMQKAAENALGAFEKLFARPDVAEVVLFAQGEFTDPQGNRSTENAVRITWTRESAAQADWEELRERVGREPERIYNLADDYRFHSGFYQSIRDKRGLGRMKGMD